ncbi:hypothetical protein M0804_009812 [Polistes exclamans]|nr:hypothetical protein M0804_009812 [Polistes exclamans]
MKCRTALALGAFAVGGTRRVFYEIVRIPKPFKKEQELREEEDSIVLKTEKCFSTGEVKTACEPPAAAVGVVPLFLTFPLMLILGGKEELEEEEEEEKVREEEEEEEEVEEVEEE